MAARDQSERVLGISRNRCSQSFGAPTLCSIAAGGNLSAVDPRLACTHRSATSDTMVSMMNLARARCRVLTGQNPFLRRRAGRTLTQRNYAT